MNNKKMADAIGGGGQGQIVQNISFPVDMKNTIRAEVYQALASAKDALGTAMDDRRRGVRY